MHGPAWAPSSEPEVAPSAKRALDQRPVFLITSITRLEIHRGEKRGGISSTSTFVGCIGCTPRDRRHAPGGGGGWHRGQTRAHGIGFLSAQRAPACGGVTPQVTVWITSWLLCETNSSAVRVEKVACARIRRRALTPSRLGPHPRRTLEMPSRPEFGALGYFSP